MLPMQQSFREALETSLGHKDFVEVELTGRQVRYHEREGGWGGGHISKLAESHLLHVQCPY